MILQFSPNLQSDLVTAKKKGVENPAERGGKSPSWKQARPMQEVVFKI